MAECHYMRYSVGSIHNQCVKRSLTHWAFSRSYRQAVPLFQLALKMHTCIFMFNSQIWLFLLVWPLNNQWFRRCLGIEQAPNVHKIHCLAWLQYVNPMLLIPDYSRQTCTISLLLMSWFLVSPYYQQQIYRHQMILVFAGEGFSYLSRYNLNVKR